MGATEGSNGSGRDQLWWWRAASTALLGLLTTLLVKGCDEWQDTNQAIEDQSKVVTVLASDVRYQIERVGQREQRLEKLEKNLQLLYERTLARFDELEKNMQARFDERRQQMEPVVRDVYERLNELRYGIERTFAVGSAASPTLRGTMPITDPDLQRLLDTLPYGEADRENLRELGLKVFGTDFATRMWLQDPHLRFDETPIAAARRDRKGLDEVCQHLAPAHLRWMVMIETDGDPDLKLEHPERLQQLVGKIAELLEDESEADALLVMAVNSVQDDAKPLICWRQDTPDAHLVGHNLRKAFRAVMDEFERRERDQGLRPKALLPERLDSLRWLVNRGLNQGDLDHGPLSFCIVVWPNDQPVGHGFINEIAIAASRSDQIAVLERVAAELRERLDEHGDERAQVLN